MDSESEQLGDRTRQLLFGTTAGHDSRLREPSGWKRKESNKIEKLKQIEEDTEESAG